MTISETLKRRRTRIRNEIAWITGDVAHGGPPRDADLAKLRAALEQIEKEIAIPAETASSPRA